MTGVESPKADCVFEPPPPPPPHKRSKTSSDSSSQPVVEETEDSDGYASDDGCKEYIKQVIASEGFDVDVYPHPDPKDYPLGCILQLPNLEKYTGLHNTVKELSLLAIRHYNNENGANYNLVKVVKANSQVCCGFKFYITFEAEDVIHGQVKIFQALVLNGIQIDEVLFCRLKPTSQ